MIEKQTHTKSVEPILSVVVKEKQKYEKHSVALSSSQSVRFQCEKMFKEFRLQWLFDVCPAVQK